MRPTREGKRFLLSTFLIAIAAVNTGNNLMYLILAMMLSVLAISFAALAVNLRGLSLSVRAEEPVFAGRKARMDLTVRNAKGRLASYSLRVRLPGHMQGEGFIAHVPASSSATGHAGVLFRRRGAYRYGDFTLESSFPFIFFTMKNKARAGGEVIVYPETREVELAPVFSGQGRDVWSTRPGRGDELLAIREFRHGDETRLVHWKASAKAEKLLVKEFSEEETRMVSIILDDTASADAAAFENAVGFAASAAWKLIDGGFYVSLITCAKVLQFGGGAEHLFKVLDLLAVIEQRDAGDCPVREEMRGGSLLVLGSEGSPLRRLAPLCDMVVYASGL